MKKLTIRVLAVSAIIAMVGGTTYGVVASKNSNKNTASNNPVNVVDSPSSTKKEQASDEKIDASKVFKDETVYVITNSNGSTKKVIVSDQLSNITESGKLEDKSNLTNILNLKGEETFAQNNDTSSLTWNANKADIFYQGTSTDKLPIEINVKYTLDGVETSPDQLKGKSGELEMQYTFVNNATETVTINDKQYTKHVPFLVLGGTMMKSNVFSNIKVDNGKVITKGDKSIVVGYAIPTLQEDLKLSTELATIPESFKISATVTNFSLDTFVTYADNSLLASIAKQSSAVDDSTKESAKKAYGIFTSLYDGSSSIYDSFTALLEKENELKTGLNQLSAGVDQLYTGIGQLDNGLSELVSHNDELYGGATQTFNSLLETATSSIKAGGLNIPDLTIENYHDTLDATIANLSDENVTALVKANVRSQVSDYYKAQITLQIANSLGYSFSTIDEYIEACQNGTVSTEVQSGIATKTDETLNSDDVQGQINETTNYKMTNDEQVKAALNAKLKEASQARTTLQGVQASLDSYNKYYVGLKNYFDGVSQAKAGADQLYASKDQLVAGVKQLSDSLMEVCNKLDSITGQINKEEIDKVQEALDKYMLLVSNKDDLDATVKASEAYTNFSGINEEMEGAVRFIYRADAI